MDEVRMTNEQDELRMDLDKLSKENLEELVLLLVRKLRNSMSQERDRCGR